MATRTLPTVKNYVKNVGKSIGFAAIEHLDNAAPNTSMFLQMNKGIFRESLDEVKKQRDKFTKSESSVQNTLKKAFEDGKKNLFADLKSGTFYNKERETQASGEIFGLDFDFNDDDFEFDFDFGDDNSSYRDDNPEFGSNTRTSSDSEAKRFAKAGLFSSSLMAKAYDKATRNATEANAKVSVHSAALISDSIAKSTSILFSQNEKLQATINANFAAFSSQLSKITNLAPNLQSHMENSKTYYEESLKVLKESNALIKEMTEMQRNLYKIKKDEYEKDDFSSIVNGGAVDLREYAKYVGKNLKNTSAGSMLDMLQAIGGLSGASKSIIASPLKGIATGATKLLFTKSMDKAIGRADDMITGIFGTIMTNLSKAAQDRNSSETVRTLAQIFGIKVKKTSNPDPSKYHKGPMPFDGYTRKAIIEVIPAYLARIESAIRGTEAAIYDYDRGRWSNLSTIKKARSDRERYERYQATSSTFKDVYKYMASLPTAEKKKLGEQFEEFIKVIFEDYGTFNTRKKKNKKTGQDQEAYEYYGFKTKEDFERILALMPRGGFYQLSNSAMNARRNLNRNASIVGTDPYMYLFNDFTGKNNKGTTNFSRGLANIKDQYDKDLFFYLRGIYAEVKAIRVGGGGGGGGGRRRKKSKTDPLAALEKEFSKNKPTQSQDNQDAEDLAFDEFVSKYRWDNDLSDTDPGEDSVLVRRLKNTKLGKYYTGAVNGIDAVLSYPVRKFTKLLDAADKRIYEVMFGDREQGVDRQGRHYNNFSDYLVTRMGETFDDIKTYLKKQFTRFETWFKNTDLYGWLNQKMNRAKDFLKTRLAPVGREAKNKLKNAFNYTRVAMSEFTNGAIGGNLSTTHDKQGAYDWSAYNDYGVGDMEDDRMSQGAFDWYGHYNGLKDLGKSGNRVRLSAKGGVVKRRGLHMLSPGEMIIPASFDKRVQRRQLKEEMALGKRLGLRGITYSAGGTIEAPPEYTQNLLHILSALYGAGSDAAYDFKGRAVGAAKNAKDKAQEKIENIDKKAIRKTTFRILKESIPNRTAIAASGLIGGGVSLLTGMVGGPLLGAAAGAGISIIRHSETAQKMIFGDEVTEEDGQEVRKGGIVSPKIQAFFKKNFKDMVGGAGWGGILGLVGPFGVLPGIALGAGAGILKNNEKFQTLIFGEKGEDGERLGGLISKELRNKLTKAKGRMFGGAILGAIVGGPFGILGNAILGSAMGFATTTETFDRIVFGHKDKDGNRVGGLVGQLNRLIQNTINFAQKHILEPMKDFAKPMLQMMKNGVQSVADRVSGFLNRMFENTLGMPLKDLVEHKIVGGLLKWMKRLLFLPVTAAKGVIAAPFHMLGFVGNNIRNSQIKKGTATDMTASQRIAWRDKHYIRNLGGLKYDRFNALDEMIAKDFNGSDGVDKMRAMREEINTFLGASKDLGARGAKLMKDIGSDISNYLNTTNSEDPVFSLYQAIGYGRIKKLHKIIRNGDWSGVLKWIDEQVKKGRMSGEQATEFANIIKKERVDEIKTIIENKEYNQKQSKQGWYQIVSTSKGTLTNKTHLRRLMRNLDTEIAAREKEDAAEAAAREAEANTPLGRFEELYKTNSVKLYNVIKAINDNLVMVNGGEGLSVDADGKVSYKTRTAASTDGTGSGINKNNSPSMSDLADKVDSGELDTQEAVDEGTGHSKNEDEKRRFRSFLSRFVTKKKNRREKDEQDSTTESPSNKSTSVGGIIKGKLSDLKNDLKNGYHLFTTKEGRMELRSAVGKRIKGPWSNKIDSEEKKEKQEKKERFNFLKTMKKVMFGKLSPIAFLRGAKNGILGLLSAFTQSKIGKVIKGVFVGATIAALLGHASQSLKTGGILAVVRDWAVEKIKSAGSFLGKIFAPIKEFLAEKFPNMFGDDGPIGKLFKGVKDFFANPKEAIKGAFEKVKKWYIDGLKYFGNNILKPFVYNLLPTIGKLLWNAIHKDTLSDFMQTVENVETIDKEYQSTDKEGQKLYKDNVTGEATTSAVDANGQANEPIMNNVTIKKTTYGDYGSNVITNIRKAVFNKRDPNGNLVAYEQEAINPITDHKFTMEVSGQGDSAGTITIKDETSGIFLMLTELNSNADVYQVAYFGYDSDQNGQLSGSASSSAAGIIVGTIVAIALSPFTGGLSLGIIGAVVAGTLVGTTTAHAIYKKEGGGYCTVCQLNMSSDAFVEILRYFALNGNTGKDIDAWPEFESSEDWENSNKFGVSSEQREKAVADLARLDVISVDEETGEPKISGKDINKLSSNFPRDATKVNVWWRHHYIPSKKATMEGAVESYGDYQWLNMPANLISDSDAGFLLKMYRDDGVEGWYDTRCTYDQLPKEIKNIVKSDDWFANENPMLTTKWPTTQKAKDTTSYTVTVSDSHTGPIYTRNGANVGTYTNKATTSTADNDGFTGSSTSKSSSTKPASEQTNYEKWGAKGRKAGKGRFDYGYDYDHVYQKSAGLRNESFGDKLFGDYGCGPATATNMINHLSGTGSILGSATNLAKRYIDSTGGTTTDYFSDIFSKSGYNTAQTIDKSKIRKGLKAGVPAVLLGNSGADTTDSPFGANDHYINVYGLDNNNNAIVEDPDLPYSRVKYPLNKVMKDVKHSTFVGAGRLSGRGNEEYKAANANYIYTWFKNLNSPDDHIAAVLSNWEAESGIDPTGVETIYSPKYVMSQEKLNAMSDPNAFSLNVMFPKYARSGINVYKSAYKGTDGKYYPGVGLGGFTGPAVSGLLEKSQKISKPWYELESQLRYMTDVEGPTYTRGKYSGRSWIDNVFNATTFSSPAQGAAWFEKNWEGSTFRQAEHMRTAQSWYDKIKNGKMSTVDLNTSMVSSSGTTTDGGNGTAANNSLTSKIAQLGRTIFTHLYGSNLTEMVMPTNTSSSGTTTDVGGASSGDGTNAAGSFVGTGDPSSSWVWPIHGKYNSYVSSKFGPRNVKGGSNPHMGIDVGGGLAGKEIVAVAPGEVVKVVNGLTSARGRYVQIKHKTSSGKDMYVIYQHNKRNTVNQGDTVRQGQTVGIVGGTGTSENQYGAHLHFEVSPDGQRSHAVDPLGYINTSRKYTGAGRSLSGRGSKNRMTSNTQLSATKEAMEQQIQQMKHPLKRRPGTVPSKQINNKFVEGLKDIVKSSDGNLYGPPILGAAGRTMSGRAATDNVNWVSFLNSIVQLLVTIANNSALLARIVEILSSSGIKVDAAAIKEAATAPVTEAERKAQIRRLVSNGNTNPTTMDVGSISNSESTQYIVQVMEALASR